MISPMPVARRWAVAAAFVATIAAAPTAALLAVTPASPGPVHLADCVSGEEEDLYTNNCVPHTVPNGPFTDTNANPDVPEIDGIPCTGANSGTCIGLSEDQVPAVVPKSSIEASP